MSDIHSSDIKNVLSQQFGGVAGDWSRASKAKNDAGEWARTFVNKRTEEQVVVTEKNDGTLGIEKQEAAETFPPRDRNPEAVKAAKAIVDVIINGYDEEDPTEALFKKTTPLAYANQFLFAVVCPNEDMKEYEVYITAKKIFNADPTCHDDASYTPHVRELLPMEHDDIASINLYACYAEIPPGMEGVVRQAPPPLETVKLLFQAGFSWDPRYQSVCEQYENVDRETGINFMKASDIKALMSGPATPAKKPPQPSL